MGPPRRLNPRFSLGKGPEKASPLPYPKTPLGGPGGGAHVSPSGTYGKMPNEIKFPLKTPAPSGGITPTITLMGRESAVCTRA